MCAHAKSDAHIQYSDAEVLAAKAEKEGSILQQLQSITEEQRIKNRKDIKALLRCTHFFSRNHIPHTTNFADLVEPVGKISSNLLKLVPEMPPTPLQTLFPIFWRHWDCGWRSFN